MKRPLSIILYAIVLVIALGIETSTVSDAVETRALRNFEFVYESRIAAIEAGQGPVHIFLPVPRDDEQQTLEEWSISVATGDNRIAGAVETESQYGNRYWHGVLPEANGVPIDIEARYQVLRLANEVNIGTQDRDLTAAEQQRLAQFLAANSRVAINHPILEPILEEIELQTDTAGQMNQPIFARGIYDWVVDNITYKKIGTGWGNGDTFWACNERYGNCTDFHSLFISLARTKGIPARFDMGFPVPEDRAQGNVAGYHCWVNFYLPEIGWVPIDASEAFNHPEKRELFYGAQPVDRIHFTTGRDLRLGDHHRDRALNYFIYPYVEVGGKRYEGLIESTFSYRDQ